MITQMVDERIDDIVIENGHESGIMLLSGKAK
jgi:hypothetical protein